MAGYLSPEWLDISNLAYVSFVVAVFAGLVAIFWRDNDRALGVAILFLIATLVFFFLGRTF